MSPIPRSSSPPPGPPAPTPHHPNHDIYRHPRDHERTTVPVAANSMTNTMTETLPATRLTLTPTSCPESTVNILIEEQGKLQKFAVHSKLLCLFSPFFEALLMKIGQGTRNDAVVVRMKLKARDVPEEKIWAKTGDDGDGDEARAREGEVEVDVRVKLPDVSPELRLPAEFGRVRRVVFAAFVEWLYLGISGFGLDSSGWDNSGAGRGGAGGGIVTRDVGYSPESRPPTEAGVLIQLWVLAGKLGVGKCQNDCIEGIERWRQRRNVIETGWLGWVYENTREMGDNRLRRLLVDQCAWKLDAAWFMHNETQFPRECLVDLVAGMKEALVIGNARECPLLRLEGRARRYWVPEERAGRGGGLS